MRNIKKLSKLIVFILDKIDTYLYEIIFNIFFKYDNIKIGESSEN